MESRIRPRKQVEHIFNNFFVFVQTCHSSNSQIDKNSPKLIYSFPSSSSSIDPEDVTVKAAKHFVFPSNEKIVTIEHFAFVITTEDGRWKFGYCRQEPLPLPPPPPHDHGSIEYSNKCSVFISEIPYWNGIFYKTIDYLTGIIKWPNNATNEFLNILYNSKITNLSQEQLLDVHVSGYQKFQCKISRGDILPSTLENRCLSEFYNSFTYETMMILFGAMLAERNILIISKKLSTLSSIVFACNMILYPLCWQHIFISILPSELSDYLEAPMPFIIGVNLDVWKLESIKRKSCQLRCVQIDADTNTILTPFPDDFNMIPKDIILFFKKNIKNKNNIFLKNNNNELLDTFLQIFIKIMGHYENPLIWNTTTNGKFNEDEFIRLAKPNHRSFIKYKLIRSQMFQQFLEERIINQKNEIMNDDIFQKEIIKYKQKLSIKKNNISSLIYLTNEPNVKERHDNMYINSRHLISMDGQSTKLVVHEQNGRDINSTTTNKITPDLENSADKQNVKLPATPRPRPRPSPNKSHQLQNNIIPPPLPPKPKPSPEELQSNSPLPIPMPMPSRKSHQLQKNYIPTTRELPIPINRARSCDVPLMSQWSDVLKDLKSNPVQLKNSNSFCVHPTAAVDKSQQSNTSYPPSPTVNKNIVTTIPNHSRLEQNLIDFDTPIVNNNNHNNNKNYTRIIPKTQSYHNELLKVFEVKLKNSDDNELF